MAISETKLRTILQQNFPDDKIIIKDFRGDQDHYSVEIHSTKFYDLSLLNQHKLVKKALEKELAGELHAITIKTKPIELQN